MGESTAALIDAQIPVVFYRGSIKGEGVLRNVSMPAALVGSATAPVVVGQKVTLELGLPSNLPSFCVVADVIRQEENGFAVRFLFDASATRTEMLGLIDLLTLQRDAVTARAALSDTLDQRRNPRRAPRVTPGRHAAVPGRVCFSCGSQTGSGTIHDISLTGAQISEASFQPAPHEQVEMLFLMGVSPRRILALARVVRRTPSGFAVRFLHLQRELERLILAATPKGGPRLAIGTAGRDAAWAERHSRPR